MFEELGRQLKLGEARHAASEFKLEKLYDVNSLKSSFDSIKSRVEKYNKGENKMNREELIRHKLGMRGTDKFTVECDSYDEVWNSKRTNINLPISFQKPKFDHSKYCKLGDVFRTATHNKRCILFDTNLPFLEDPIDYVEVWSDKGSKCPDDCSVWMPVGPAGYVPLGSIVIAGYSKPDTKKEGIKCIWSDVLDKCDYIKVWNDAGSRSFKDLTLWIDNATGYFMSSPKKEELCDGNRWYTY